MNVTVDQLYDIRERVNTWISNPMKLYNNKSFFEILQDPDTLVSFIYRPTTFNTYAVQMVCSQPGYNNEFTYFLSTANTEDIAECIVETLYTSCHQYTVKE